MAAGAAVLGEVGRLLLQRRVDNGLWVMFGRAMDVAESLPETAVREVREGTGHDVEVAGLVDTCTDARHIIACSDGEVRRQFNVCSRARLIGGVLAVSDESPEVRWLPPKELEGVPMHHTQHLRVEHALHGSAPYLG
ncbi:NUDIX domain-containing protein [Nocardiopsis sp. NPDC050513]|uniref:NUDIX domain-containing protein n=1 Tax=Nocardiopsis sp. NPDC050513 TaxID=3364338 RepID=UPI0037B10F4F